MLQKTFLPASFLAAPLAVGLALAGAPDQAAASTITGSVVLDLNATVEEQFDDSFNLSQIDIGGSFTTLNTLTCYTECTEGWAVASTVSYGSFGSSTLVEANGEGLNWNNIRTTPGGTVSLFSVVSFFDHIISTALGSGGNAAGTRSIGGSSVAWTVSGATVDQFLFEESVATSGSFTMSIDASDLEDFMLVFGGFDGIDRDPEGASPRGGGTPVSATVTVTPSSGAAVIPVPASLPLLAGGLGVFGLVAWRRRARAA